MRKNVINAICILCTWRGVCGQDSPKPEFIAATIKQNNSDGEPGNILTNKGTFTARAVSLKLMLAQAYGVALQSMDNYIVGAPAWVDSSNFDLVAKIPPATTEHDLALMLRGFLEQEFRISSHQEQRPVNVFVLAGKGGALKSKTGIGSPASDDKGCRRQAGAVEGQQRVVCTNMRTADLAAALPNLAPRYIDRPVVDETGLTGVYDFQLEWAGRAAIDSGGLTIFDALSKLGFRMEQRKVPQPVVVIDHIEKLAEDR